MDMEIGRSLVHISADMDNFYRNRYRRHPHLSLVIKLMISCFVKLGGRFPRFVSREMEVMYIEELQSSVNLLMANLESMPVSKGGEFKLQKLKRGHNTSIMDMGQEDENVLSKSDVILPFTLE
ncbi:hypothetical protein XENORESO_014416, partial [Xenotaenia resolanae]